MKKARLIIVSRECDSPESIQALNLPPLGDFSWFVVWGYDGDDDKYPRLEDALHSLEAIIQRNEPAVAGEASSTQPLGASLESI